MRGIWELFPRNVLAIARWGFEYGLKLTHPPRRSTYAKDALHLGAVFFEEKTAFSDNYRDVSPDVEYIVLVGREYLYTCIAKTLAQRYSKDGAW